MTDLPRRRLMDKAAGPTSLLAPEIHVTGDIETAGGLMVCGRVQGNGRIGSELNVALGAHWEGHVHTRRAVINGEVSGSLLVEEKLEIGATAVIHGRITARQIAIARGATIDGEMVVTGSEPVIEFEEKRVGR
ncbi:MAG: polymer-forming cytoskeletal protein [Steroidobacteraceae bacterium]